MASTDITLAADECGLEELSTELRFDDAGNGSAEGEEQHEQYNNVDTGIRNCGGVSGSEIN